LLRSARVITSWDVLLGSQVERNDRVSQFLRSGLPKYLSLNTIEDA